MKRFLKIGAPFCFVIMVSQFLLADDGPTLTRTEVKEYQDKNVATWFSKVEKGKGRLFYSEAQWPKEIARVLALKGKAAEWRQLLYDSAVRIASSKIPPYLRPDQMPGAVNASEEGWQRGFGNQIVCLAAAAKLWPEPRFGKALHDRTLAACHFETWGRQGKNGELANMDLAAGHVMAGISIAYDWHRGLFSLEERQFIRDTMEKRVHRMLEGLYGAVYWANWYSQNHNHVSVAGMGLAGLAFLDEIPEASEWLAGATLDFQRVVGSMAVDGGSYEGVAYWGYGRNAILEFIEGTRNVVGTDNLYDSASMRNAAAFRIACSTPGFDGVLTWADSRGHDVCGPQNLLVRLASQYRLEEAQYLAEHMGSVPASGTLTLPWAVLWYDPSVSATPPKRLDYHAPVWDVITTRSGWGDGDYLLSIKSGVNRDHHTHLDAGSISFNFGGTWLLLAPGYGLGLGQDKFFDMRGGGRWNFFSASSESHTTLRINGKNQRSDTSARGTVDHFLSTPSSLWAEVDLHNAYEGVTAVRRRVLHRRGNYVLVLDEASSREPISVEWLAQVPPRARLNGTTVTIDGGRGDLSFSLIGEASPFTDYQPSSPIVDVSPNRMKTVASKVSGSTVKLAVLLKPHFSGTSPSSSKATFESRPNGSHTRITGTDWQDDIWIGPASDALSFAEIKSSTGAIAVRKRGNKVFSIEAVEASRLSFEGAELSAQTATDMAVEQIAPGVCALSVGNLFRGTISLPSGVRLFRENGTAISLGVVELSPGRYWILDGRTTVSLANESVSALFPPRPAPQPFVVAEKLGNFADAPTQVVIHWEAEEAPLQQGGMSSSKAYPKASGGKAIDSFGMESPSHSIGWKITIPQDGNYFLKLRYAIGQPEAKITLLVDGKVPTAKALSIALAGLQGWGEGKDWFVGNREWMESLLSDASGPLRIGLAKGDHEIRLASPTEGINLDSLELVGAAASTQGKTSP